MQVITNSEAETKNIAEKLAKKLSGVIALSGELGAGKTTFVQGFAKGLGIKEKIISPTFVLIRQHKVPNSEKMLYHVDLYRLEGEKQLKQLGLDDLFNDPKNIMLIEWAEKLKDLPKNTINIKIKKMQNNKRRLEIRN